MAPQDDIRSSGPVSGLLFDLDGTLIATRRLYLEAFADALEPLLGHRPSHDEMIARHPRSEVRFLKELTAEAVLGSPTPEVALPGASSGSDQSGSEGEGGAPGPDRSTALRAAEEAVLDRFFDSYRRRHTRDFEGVYPGVRRMLELGRERGLPLGLVTGKSRSSWAITRPLVELGEFHTLVFDDDVPDCKPDPAGLHMAIESLELTPAETLYVGDSVTDLEAAVRAGIRPVAVLWSKRPHEREPFRQAALDRGGEVLRTPDDLARLITRKG